MLFADLEEHTLPGRKVHSISICASRPALSLNNQKELAEARWVSTDNPIRPKVHCVNMHFPLTVA